MNPRSMASIQRPTVRILTTVDSGPTAQINLNFRIALTSLLDLNPEVAAAFVNHGNARLQMDWLAEAALEYDRGVPFTQG